MKKLLIVLHNVYSYQRVIEMARLVYGLNFDTLIISRALSTAAQSGVPEAQKIAIKRSKNLFYVNDLNDIIDLFQPITLFMFVPKPYAPKPFDINDFMNEINKQNVALVFGGSEPGLTKKELDMGNPVFLEHVEEDIGPIGYAAIVLYQIKLRIIKSS